MTIISALMGIPSIRVHAQESKPTEYEVKAAYLYMFGRFAEWPLDAKGSRSDSFTICVLGQDPFGSALDSAIADEQIGGRRVVAKRFSKPEDMTPCRIVFISSSEKKKLNEILAVLDKEQILTVSDIAGFLRHGGMIEFVLEGDRVRFEVNLATARASGLKLSSELLKVALAVRSGSQPGE